MADEKVDLDRIKELEEDVKAGRWVEISSAELLWLIARARDAELLEEAVRYAIGYEPMSRSVVENLILALPESRNG